MSEQEETDIESRRKKFAKEFDRELDPLADKEDRFLNIDEDPFELFIDEILSPGDPSESTLVNYRTTFEQWQDYMNKQGRHPACPNEHHVKGFIRYQCADPADGGLGNHRSTLDQKLFRLNRFFQYLQAERPFPQSQDYNPIEVGKEKASLPTPDEKNVPEISVAELRNILAGITHYRKRAILLTQLKLGLRQGELCNIQLQDLHIANAELRRHFPAMGAHPSVVDYNNAIYIPSQDERDGNKSERPRVVPLDDELRRVLLRYLLVRPDNGEPWLFLTLKTHGKITDNQTINDIWRDAFHPEYAETEDEKAVTSHYGRHWFSTWWRVKRDINRQLVKYMRGDVASQQSLDDRAAIDDYLHTNYEDIETPYREEIFKLGL